MASVSNNLTKTDSRCIPIEKFDAVLLKHFAPLFAGRSKWRPERSTRPSSCCRGHSRKARQPRSTWPSSNTQHVLGDQRQDGGPLDHYPGDANGRRSRSRPIRLQHLLLTAEKKFWRCVRFGQPPRLFGVEPPKARIEGVRIVDMASSNAWAELAALFRCTRTRPSGTALYGGGFS
jgi:hypothetical protein